MTRLALLILLAILAWSYFPETRAMLIEAAEPVIVPVIRWSAEEEMRQIGRNVVEYELLTGELPTGSAWLEWLDYRYSAADMKVDPWGSVYQIEVSRDSVFVLSFGPDRTRGTPDDFTIASPRR